MGLSDPFQGRVVTGAKVRLYGRLTEVDKLKTLINRQLIQE